MPQEHNVLKCYSCETFQVHIVKKAKKWECKICGAKQSFKRSYGQGSGKDCRLHVMKINELRVRKESNLEESIFNQSFNLNDLNDLNEKSCSIEKKPVTNKWLQYIDDDELEDMDLNNEVDSIANDKKRKRMDDSELIFESNNKRICNKEKTNDSKLPHEIFVNNESHLKRNKDSIKSENIKKGKEITGDREFKDDVKLENKKQFDCIKKSSTNIFNSNPNDLEELINISF